MAKPLLWLVFSALTAAFFASVLLQESRAYYEESERRNGRPAGYFLTVVEPKMRAAEFKYGHELNACAAPPSTVPTTGPAQ
jgi:hypothetical protein